MDETGWAIAANPMGMELLPFKAGSPTVPMPGYNVQVLHADGYGCEAGGRHLPQTAATAGHSTLWGDDARFIASYLAEHPGYYLTGDGGYIDEDGYLFVMGASMMSSTLRGTGCRPGSWRPSWPRIPRWPSVP